MEGPDLTIRCVSSVLELWFLYQLLLFTDSVIVDDLKMNVINTWNKVVAVDTLFLQKWKVFKFFW